MTADTPVPKRNRRWWIPVTIVIAAASTIGWSYATEHTLRTHALQILSSLGFGLIALWFLFLSGLPSRIKWPLAGVLALLGGTGALAVSQGWIRPKLADGSGWFTFEFGSGREPLPELEFKAPPAGSGDAEGSDPNDFLRAESRFLGPEGDGIIPSKLFANGWEKHAPRELWRRQTGPGWSAFAVSNGRAVTQEQRDEDELTVCYDLLTGDPLWASKNNVRFEEGMGGPGPRATPTIAGGRVFAHGATGILKCLDLESGEVIWQKDTLAEFDSPNVMYGKSSAPLISGENVIVSGGENGPTLIALRRTDGETVWKSGTRETSYASPVLRTLGGVRQVVSVNATSLTGHDPESGTELWAFPWPGVFPKVGQPVSAGDDRLLITSDYGMDTILVEVKKSPDGKWRADELWRTNRMKTKFSSAVVHGDFAYGIDSGTFTCISLKNGERVWKDGRYGFGQNLLVGNIILVQAERGDVVLVEANPEKHQEISRLPALNAKSWTVPTLAGKYLLVRSEEEAVCYEVDLELSEVVEPKAAN